MTPAPMTPKEINRNTLNSFLVRAVGHAWANAIDAEHGLRVSGVAVTDTGFVRIDLEGGHSAIISMVHSLPTSKPLFDDFERDMRETLQNKGKTINAGA